MIGNENDAPPTVFGRLLPRKTQMKAPIVGKRVGRPDVTDAWGMSQLVQQRFRAAVKPGAGEVVSIARGRPPGHANVHTEDDEGRAVSHVDRSRGEAFGRAMALGSQRLVAWKDQSDDRNGGQGE
jgi:hypothetical protein